MGEITLYRGEHDREPVLRSGKSLAVLAYLALSPGERASRGHLGELLWPALPSGSRQHNLRQALYRLRRAAPNSVLTRASGAVGLGPGVGFDFREGEAALAGGQHARAEQLLRGDFLGRFSIPEAREFTAWVEAQRERFGTAWEQAARALVAERLADGDPEGAQKVADALATRRPFDDAAIRLLMVALAVSGHYALAVARFRAYARLLATEMDEKPTEDLRRYAQDLDACADSTVLRPGPHRSGVGRSAAWAVLESTRHSAPDRGAGMLLIQGKAGVGKTRLLTELSERARLGGTLVLTAKCSELNGRAWGAVLLLRDSLVEAPGLERVERSILGDLARLIPELRERFSHLPASGALHDGSEGEPLTPSQALGALVRSLHELGRRQGLVLAIDDLHLADGESVHLVLRLLRALRGTRTLLVATCTPDRLGFEVRRRIEAAVPEGLGCVIPLLEGGDRQAGEPAGEGASTERQDDERVVAQLERLSGGDPSILYELLDALPVPPTEGGRGTRSAVGLADKLAALRRAVWSMISEGP